MKSWCKVAVVAWGLAATAWGQSNAVALAVGGAAPEFAAVGTNGRTNCLADLKGTWVVLYFYPKAFTPGCTAEACSLRDGYTDLQKRGAVILGVSLDGLDKLNQFKEAYHLPFDLLSDRDKAISTAYHTLGFGGVVAERRTFVISPAGVIAHVFDTVSPRTHDKDVLAVLERLQGAASARSP